ncbi:MAG: hypothetical protein GF330_09845 [Candidatus Eisenbacteria bacterium]|nr:hypothetical protein [Candidatus Eisenbacteria bacterium]
MRSDRSVVEICAGFLSAGPAGWRFSFLALLIPIWAGAAAAAGGVEIERISESDTQILFAVRTPRPQTWPVELAQGRFVDVAWPGAERITRPGAPELPFVEVRVAVPPGADPIASVVEAAPQTLIEGRPLPAPEREIRDPHDRRPGSPDALPQFVSERSPDPLIYESGAIHPSRAVAAGAVHNWRHYRVAPIRIYPVRYDGASRRLLWSERILVRVQFAPRSEVSPGGAPPGGRPYPRGEGRWEAVFRNALLNYRSAGAFKRAPAERARLRSRAPQPSEEQFRLSVARTGLYRVAFDDLVGAGLGAEDLAWSALRLTLRDYDDSAEEPFVEQDVSFLPDDQDADGRYGPGDGFFFYGLDAWDLAADSGQKRYGRASVFWLGVGGDAGAQMDTGETWFGWEGLEPPATFEHTLHFEENLWYMPSAARGPGGDTRSPVPGPFAIETDHYNWTYFGASRGTVPLSIQAVPLDLPALDAVAEICVHLQGQYQSDLGHQPRLWLSDNETTEISEVWGVDWAFPGNPYVFSNLYDISVCVPGEEIPSDLLGTGRSYLKIYQPANGDGYDGIDADGAGIDWVEVTYRGFYRMYNQRLRASLTGLSGPQQLRVRMIRGTQADPPTDALLVFDLTDSLAPRHLTITEAQLSFSEIDRRWELTLQIDCGDGQVPRQLLVIERDQIDDLPAEAVTARASEPLDAFAGEDLVAVYPQRFAEEIEPLLSHREDQGHHVLRAPAQSVYDTYSGGRPHPYAIKRLLRAMWRQSDPPPEYLLLFGDASNDIAGYGLDLPSEQADTNWVPAPTLVGPWSELIPCDHWYVDNLGSVWGSDMSFLPDLHVGRVSCGTPAEAASYVAKVLAYEEGDPRAAWRNRVILVSDDNFSSRLGGIGGSGVYEYQSSETSFLHITRRARATYADDSLFAHFETDSLYLSVAMDTLVELGRCLPDTNDPSRCLCSDLPWPWPRNSCYYTGGIDYLVNKAYGEGSGAYAGDGLRAVLMDQLGRGALVWAFQGHSNRSLLTHEYIFRHSPLAGRTDATDLTNQNRPFFFMGYGCHLADYASHWEGDSRRGDAMEEIMLFCCEGQPRGAIGALASVDYEWIGHDIQEKIFAAMFSDPPADPQDPAGPSRWRMGEIVSHGKTKVSSQDRNERITYALLGDPALRLGLAPPVLRLSLNGTAWDPAEGAEYVSDRDDDSLHLAVRIFDDSRVGFDGLSDYYGNVPEDSLVFESSGEDDRRLTVRYATRLQRRPYEIRVTASDYDGSQESATIQVPMSVGLFEQVEDELIPLGAGSALDDTATVVVTVRCGAHLTAEDVELLADDLPLELREAVVDEQSGEPFLWTLRFEGLRDVGQGEVTLDARVRQHDGSWESFASVGVRVGQVALRFAAPPFWMPSPFDDYTYLVYDLTARAARVQLRIFTSSGRLILEDDTLPTRKSQRHWPEGRAWDGRDDDGDPIGNGLYFYELTIWDNDGRVADRALDKLVRVR